MIVRPLSDRAVIHRSLPGPGSLWIGGSFGASVGTAVPALLLGIELLPSFLFGVAAALMCGPAALAVERWIDRI